MPPKGWKKDTAPELGTPEVHQPVSVDIVQNPTPEPINDAPTRQIIQPVSVEYGTPAKPTRTSQPVKSQPHKTGAFLVDKARNKRTWMDRAMANIMAKSNSKRYTVED